MYESETAKKAFAKIKKSVYGNDVYLVGGLRLLFDKTLRSGVRGCEASNNLMFCLAAVSTVSHDKNGDSPEWITLESAPLQIPDPCFANKRYLKKYEKNMKPLSFYIDAYVEAHKKNDLPAPLDWKSMREIAEFALPHLLKWNRYNKNTYGDYEGYMENVAFWQTQVYTFIQLCKKNESNEKEL